MNLDPSLRAIFNEALDRRDAAERARYLDEACGADAALRERVENLLRADGEAGGFFSDPTSRPQSFTPDAATLICSPPVTEKAGDRIGHYKLLQQIGEGGCGVVYMAEQEEPVRRRVALKVIKLGMDTKHVVARFEAERQALALMDHPNIAQVFDAGATDSGRPFFVMELVRGVKITEFCDDKKLSTQERLDLFRQVCAAIQHAHQKGIIHRDLKPSNILVTMIDGAAVPKVIDFGIAKATNNQPLTDKTLFTAFEQFIGTPAYMSPEQAEMSGVDVDTRTDIYSLGVVLYELLTGRTPFDSGELLRGGLDEIRRTIREQEPPKPSTRLHALAQADLTTVAQARHTDAPKLVHQVRGDLDWVVMKCLEKDRNRRYETVNGLAMDVQRHLHNEPVAARPPTRAYRLQKLVRRNKLAFAAASAVTAALVIGLGISTWMFFKEKQARERAVAAEKSQSQERKKAETEAAKSQQVAQFLKNMLNGVGPSVARGRDIVMLREILDNTAGQVGKDMKDQPLVEAELRRTIGVVYFALGQYEKAEAMHRDALRLRKSLLGETNTLVADSLNDLADAVEARGEFARAEAMYREALALRKRLLGERHPDVATSLHSLALALYDQHKLAEAETMNRQALAMRRELRGNSHLEVASSLTSLALVLRDLKKPAEAETLYREALATQKQLQGNESPQIAATLNGLANVLNDQDNMFNDQAKLAEAESSYREALAMRRKMLGNEHPGVAIALTSLANLLKRQNKPAEAEALYREALAIRRKLFGNEHLQVIKLLDPLASVLRAQRKWAEAETLHREAIAHYENLAANSPNLLDYWQQLARNHHQLGLLLQNDRRKPEAEVELRKAQELWRQHPDPAVDLAKKAAETQPYNTAESSWANLFIIYYNAGEWENCLWAIKKHEQVRSANGGGQSGWEWLHEAMAHWQLDHQEEARKWFYKSIGWMDDVQESRLRERQAEAAALLGLPDPGGRSGKAAAYLKQGHAWQQQGEIEKAREAYGQAIGIYESLAADFPRVPAYQKKLIDLLTRAGRPQAAENIYRQLESVIREELATRRKLLGNEHLDVAATLRELADVLQRQGKSAEAEVVWREELAVRRKLFGNEHLEVAQALSNLSFWFRDHGNLPEAETTARELLAIRKKLLGNEHADVAQSLHLLAWNLNLAGKHTEAERLSREEVSMWRKLLGNEHPNVAWALGDLTTFLRDQGKLSEAETTIRESLAIRQKRLANNHPDVINSLNLLADLLRAQGKLAEVETLYREELAQQRAVRGSDSPAVAETLSNLAASLQSQGKLAEAEKMFREAMEIILKLRDQNLARLPALVRRLVDVLKAQGKSQDAEKLYEETIQGARQTLGESDPALGELLHDYGEFLFFHQGRFAAAAEQYIKSLPIRRARQDDDLAWTLRNLGFVLLRAAKPKEAEPYLRESLALHHKLHPQEDTYGTAEPTERLADSLYQQRKLPQAEQVYREALVAYAKTQGCGGVGHTRVAQSLVRLLMSENKLTEAETFLKDLLSQQRQSPGDRPVAVTSTLLELANVLKTQNKSEEAANRFREALEIASTFRADMTNASPLNEVAWQLVTAENPTSWDAAVAVELAKKAVAATSQKDPGILDTLAAGYAAAGQFTNAVRVQQEAIALLTNDVSKVDFASRLKLYESNTPYRDPSRLAEFDQAEIGQKVAAPKP